MKKTPMLMLMLILPTLLHAEQLIFNIPNSPAKGSYYENTLSEKSWHTLTISDAVTIDAVTVSYTWNTDYEDNNDFRIKSPAGTEASLWVPDGDGMQYSGDYTESVTAFNGESAAGNWIFWIIAPYGEGEHQATNITLTIDYTVPTVPIKLSMVKDIHASGSSYSESSDDVTALVIGETLFFSADDGSHGRELWKSDGTEAGTVLIKDIYTGSTGSSPANFKVIDGTLYFVATHASSGKELWKSDGTESGTVLVKDINTSGNASPGNLTVLGSHIYFSAYRSSDGRELWKSDGTSEGTTRVKEIYADGSSLNTNCYLMALNNALYFQANDNINGIELWTSDGTPEGTVILKDIKTGASSSNPAFLTAVGSTLYFAAEESTHGREIWRSDGTESGTTLVKDIRSGTGASMPYDLTSVNGQLYFWANDYVLGDELYISDGTADGTGMVKDIRSGSGSSHGAYSGQQDRPIVFNNKLYFWANNGTNGDELWMSDGTESGTAMVKDINASSSSALPFYLCELGSRFFFAATDADHGRELWSSDGTNTGTLRVSDINSGTGSAYPVDLIAMGNALYFWASDGTNGVELWKYTPNEASSGSVEVDGNGTVDFGSATGISIDFSATTVTSGYLDVAVFSGIPDVTTGLPDLTISSCSIEITELGAFAFSGGSARIFIDPAHFPGTLGFSGEPTVAINVYHRSTFGSGAFTDLNVDLQWDGARYFFDTSSFSEFTFAFQPDNSLPVSLAAYSLKQRAAHVVLSWTTESELNHLGFEVQRKAADAPVSAWLILADHRTLPSLRSSGNTSEMQCYTFTDSTARSGASYQYRLAMAATDGTLSYTATREIRVKSWAPLTFSLSNGFPNPFNPETTFNYTVARDGIVNADIFNVLGQKVKSLLHHAKISAGSHTLHWDGDTDSGTHAASGLYILRLESGGKIKTTRIMLTR